MCVLHVREIRVQVAHAIVEVGSLGTQRLCVLLEPCQFGLELEHVTVGHPGHSTTEERDKAAATCWRCMWAMLRRLQLWLRSNERYTYLVSAWTSSLDELDV